MSVKELSDIEKYVSRIRSLLTRDLTGHCLSLFLILMILGTALLNVYMVYAGSGVLACMFMSLIIPRPRAEVRLVSEKAQYRVGEIFDLNVRVLSDSGLGLITVRIELPENVELVQGRTTFMIVKGLGKVELSYKITLRARKTGNCKIVVKEIESFHIFGIGGPKRLSNTESIEVSIVPYIVQPLHGPRIRPLRARTQPLHVSRLMIGAASTEFREIRKYVPGDPIKNINWKATARVGSEIPLVNEYEKESISRILIVPDLSRRTIIEGSGVNVQEEILSVMFSLMRILLRKGCRITVMHPYSGKLVRVRGVRDYVRLYREIVDLRNRETEGQDVISAVQNLKIRGIDYSIILTYIDPGTVRSIENIRKVLKSRVIVVDFEVSKIMEHDMYIEGAVDMYLIYKLAFQKYLRRRGVEVILHKSGSRVGELVYMLTCRIS
ncbi:MAG: DUF58 domain-containing protein [Crenarchaeota archaeon]|nr:DUF58 domain-containing protein [Thermoproteota archaeon]